MTCFANLPATVVTPAVSIVFLAALTVAGPGESNAKRAPLPKDGPACPTDMRPRPAESIVCARTSAAASIATVLRTCQKRRAEDAWKRANDPHNPNAVPEQPVLLGLLWRNVGKMRPVVTSAAIPTEALLGMCFQWTTGCCTMALRCIGAGGARA